MKMWIFIILPTLVYPSITFSYGRILKFKLSFIKKIMRKSDQIAAWYAENLFQVEIFGVADSKTEKSQNQGEFVNKLFERFYGWKAYLLPVIVNMIVAAFVAILFLAKAGVTIGSEPLTSLLQKVTKPALAGFVGAYLWGIYDILMRYRTMDLTPESMHNIWSRMLIAGFLGYIIAAGLKENVAVLVAFGLGAFPLRTLRNLLFNRVKKQLNMTLTQPEGEKSALHKIQGLSETVVNRLAEEGIDSVQHVANADPIKLLLRTNIDWNVLMDIINQSNLYICLGENALKLYHMGLRGAQEVAQLKYDLESTDNKTAGKAKELVKLIAKTIEKDERGILSLVEKLADDAQVVFIWRLWYATASTTASTPEAKAGA